MKSYFLESPPEFLGLKPQHHWAKSVFGIEGDSILAFAAPESNVHFFNEEPPKERSRQYLHFMVEHFSISLREMLLFERLLMDHVVCISGSKINREGDKIRNVSGSIISKTHRIWRPISAFYYLRVALQNPAQERIPEFLVKEWKKGVKSFTIDIMQAYVEDVIQSEKSASDAT
jgi:hypothetical protein